MTMAHERRVALEWAGELLRLLASPPGKFEEIWGGAAPPPKLRDWARHILRHYPEPWQIEAAVKNEGPLCWWIGDEPPL